MKIKDIKTALADDPRTTFAVKLPAVQYGRKSSDTHEAAVSIEGTTLIARRPQFDDAYVVQPQAVLDTWADHTFNIDHALALQMDSQRDFQIAYDRERAVLDARIESFLPAFAGIQVQPSGSANFEREDVDLSDRLREDFIERRSESCMFRASDFEAIAARIVALQNAALDAGGTWGGGGAVDTGVATVDPLDALRAAVSAMDSGPTDDEVEEGYNLAIREVLELIEGLSK